MTGRRAKKQPRTAQPSISAQADRPYLDQPQARLAKKANDLAPREEVHRQSGGALMRRHDEIAALLAAQQRTPPVFQQEAAAEARPEVERAVVDVEDEDAAGLEQAAHVLEDLPPGALPFDKTERAEEAGGIVEGFTGQGIQFDDVRGEDPARLAALEA